MKKSAAYPAKFARAIRTHHLAYMHVAWVALTVRMAVCMHAYRTV